MSADQYLEQLTIGAGLLLGLLVLALGRSPRGIAALLVGATGALIGAQVSRIHLFTLAVLLWLCFTHPFGTRRWLRVLALMSSAGLLATTVLYGQLVNSQTLALQLLALTGSACLIALRAQAADAALMLRGALVVITAGALIALLQVVGIVPIETWHNEVSALGRPIGIWPEPDWLGLMSAVGVILAWRLPLSGAMRTAALTLVSATLVLSFARGAWLALAASIGVAIIAGLFARPRDPHSVAGRRKAIAVLSVVAGLALTVSPNLRSDLGRRVATLTAPSTDDVSGQARLQQIEGLWTLAESAAPFGHGLSASGRVGVSGNLYLAGAYENNVASNWLLGLWVDGALLALPLVLLVLFFAVRGVSLVAGQALLVVLANSLFSNAFFQPVTWVMMGIAMAMLTPGTSLGQVIPASSSPADLVSVRTRSGA